MAKGYWIAHIEVRDAENYKPYLLAATEAVKSFGGQFLVRGEDYEQVEGRLKPRHILVEFDSYERARECYHSDAYQRAASLRRPYSDGDIVIVRGAG